MFGIPKAKSSAPPAPTAEATVGFLAWDFRVFQ
jgi:hypothetical protein